MVWKEWASGCCSQRAHPWCPCHRRWRRQGWREDHVDLLQRKTVGESIRVHPWCPCRRRWRRHGWHKGWVDLLRRKTVGESAGQHGRLERLLYVDPPPNQVISERCQSRGRGRGATSCSHRGRERRWWWCRGATTAAAGSAAVMSSSLTPRLS
jgi:hypothetical protein